jgi:hypothetical protein
MKRRDFFRVAGAVTAASVVGKVTGPVEEVSTDIEAIGTPTFRAEDIQIALQKTYGQEEAQLLAAGTPYDYRNIPLGSMYCDLNTAKFYVWTGSSWIAS